MRNQHNYDTSTYDTINVHVRGLKALGINSEQYGIILIPGIISRVSKDISLQIAWHISKEIWSISELLQIIKQEMQAREMRDYIQIEGKTAMKPVEPLPTAKS